MNSLFFDHTINMYPYHNRNIQRIKNGELIGVKKGEGEYAVILVFKSYPYSRPIKHKSLLRYKDYIDIGEYKAIAEKNGLPHLERKKNAKR